VGTLTTFLQQRFAEELPAGWTSRPEVGLASPATEALLGYAPRADVLDEVRRQFLYARD